MSELRRIAAVLAVAGALLVAPAAGTANASPSPTVDRINEVRRAHGIRPARYSPSLSDSSLAFSRRLARTQRFAHAPRIIASNSFSRLGEVLALTFGRKLRHAQTVEYWLDSPTHRAVILSPVFRYLGAARFRGHFEGHPAVFWTVQLGA